MHICDLTCKMIDYSQGNTHDIAHFLKVFTYARTIGEKEQLDAKTQQILETAALVHDIAIPLCKEKYGSSAGPLQEKEGGPLAEAFLRENGVEEDVIERVSYLVAHHHTYKNVDGMDYRILLEADFLVNADEGQMSAEAIRSARDHFFETETGTALLNSIYQKKLSELTAR